MFLAVVSQILIFFLTQLKCWFWGQTFSNTLVTLLLTAPRLYKMKIFYDVMILKGL